jgi:hypothetical protein
VFADASNDSAVLQLDPYLHVVRQVGVEVGHGVESRAGGVTVMSDLVRGASAASRAWG